MLVLNLEEDVVIGHTMAAMQFADECGLNIILNSRLKYHSYEPEEEMAASMLWNAALEGRTPFTTPPVAIDLRDGMIVHHPRVKTSIVCPRVHLFSASNVACSEVDSEVDYYRVIDWLDVRGSSETLEVQYHTWGKVKSIKTFPSTRIDQKNDKRDVLVEQHLTSEDLQDLEYSDTTIRQKLEKLFSSAGVETKMNLWKRDVYPIEKQLYHVVELTS